MLTTVLVDPAGAPAFRYTIGDVVVVYFRCQFGWRPSPWFDPYSHPRLSTPIHSTFKNASILPEGAAAVQHVQQVPPQDVRSAVPLPHDCQQITGADGLAVSSFFIRYYVGERGVG